MENVCLPKTSSGCKWLQLTGAGRSDVGSVADGHTIGRGVLPVFDGPPPTPAELVRSSTAQADTAANGEGLVLVGEGCRHPQSGFAGLCFI